MDQATRTSRTCFIVGLKENLEVQVSNGVPWLWRRIVFRNKSGNTLGGTVTPGTASGSYYQPALQTSNGFVRMLNQVLLTDRTALYGLLFRGGQNVDWTDPMVAALDRAEIDVVYDRTTSIASGNEDGCIRRYNRWHPMRKNLVYADDELGGVEQGVPYSVRSKQGCGDVWVIDLFRARTGAALTDQLLFSANSTLYWHER